MSLSDDLTTIQTAENTDDAVIAQCASDISAVITNVQNLLNQIPTAATAAEVHALAIQASAQVGTLGAVKTSLDSLVTSSANLPPTPPAVTVTITPTTAVVSNSGTIQFTATASDGSAVTYSVSDSTLGNVSAAGLFTADPTNQGAEMVIASNSAGISATANVTVGNPASPSFKKAVKK